MVARYEYAVFDQPWGDDVVPTREAATKEARRSASSQGAGAGSQPDPVIAGRGKGHCGGVARGFDEGMGNIPGGMSCALVSTGARFRFRARAHAHAHAHTKFGGSGKYRQIYRDTLLFKVPLAFGKL